MAFDYFSSREADQFSFYRIPQLLFKDEFRKMSCDAKLLYGLMLDRMGLSIKNGWVDDKKRVFIYYSASRAMNDIRCASQKCAKIFKELETFGLIEKKKQYLGNPDRIYVKNFIQNSKEGGHRDNVLFDYFYGEQALQFSFFRIPKVIVKEQDVSCEAKLLYGLMLDRMGLSAINGWVDDDDKIYIYFSAQEAMEKIGCASQKCTKIMALLEEKGLIRRDKQHLGKCDRIYVMNFVKSRESGENTRLLKIKSQEIRKSNLSAFENQIPGDVNIESKDIRKSNTNNTYTNNTKESHTHSINQEQEGKTDAPVMEDLSLEDKLKDRFEYDIYMERLSHIDRGIFKNLFDLVVDSFMHDNPIRVNGVTISARDVRAQFGKLTGRHLEYLTDTLSSLTPGKDIKDARSYMLASLYRAPMTMETDIQLKIARDEANYLARQNAGITGF